MGLLFDKGGGEQSACGWRITWQAKEQTALGPTQTS